MDYRGKRMTRKQQMVRAYLNDLLDRHGIVDISVGIEHAMCISRRMLIKTAKLMAEEPGCYIFRMRKGTDVITVLSRLGRNTTKLNLEKRYIAKTGG